MASPNQTKRVNPIKLKFAHDLCIGEASTRLEYMGSIGSAVRSVKYMSSSPNKRSFSLLVFGWILAFSFGLLGKES